LKARPACAACLLLRRAFELEYLRGGETAGLSWFRSIVETAGLYFGPDIEVATLASMTFRRMKSLLRSEDPYRNVNRRELSLAMEAAERVRELILKERDEGSKLSMALKLASYATLAERGLNNFAMGYTAAAKLITSIDAVMSMIGVREGRIDSNKIYAYLKSRLGATVYYLFGTVVELPFDLIVVDLLKELFNAYIVAVVRSSAYEDYVTIRDAEEVGLEDHVDEVIETESDSVTVTLEESSSIYAAISSSDMVIVKGELQSLYYINNPPGPPMVLMVSTKCPIAAAALGIREDTVNVIFIEARRKRGQPG
jgi:uncharacterized protein with ATP-grasp and redox domains